MADSDCAAGDSGCNCSKLKSDREGQGLGENKGGAGLKVQTGTISPSAEGRRWIVVEGVQRRAIIFVAIGLQLEREANSIRAKREAIVASPHALGPFDKGVTIADAAHGNDVRAKGRGSLRHAAPALPRVIDESRDGKVELIGAFVDFQQHLDGIGFAPARQFESDIVRARSPQIRSDSRFKASELNLEPTRRCISASAMLLSL